MPRSFISIFVYTEYIMKHICFAGFTDQKLVEIIKYLKMSFGNYTPRKTEIVVMKDGYKRETKVLKMAKENHTRIMERSYFIKLYVPGSLMTLYEKCKYFEFANEPNKSETWQTFFGDTKIMNESNIINNRAFLQYRKIYVNDIFEQIMPDAAARNLLYVPDKDVFVALDNDKTSIIQVTASLKKKLQIIEKKQHPVMTKDPKKELHALSIKLRKDLNALLIY